MNIAEAIKRCAEEAVETKIPCDVIIGEVLSVDPIKIRAGSLTLDGETVILADVLREKKAEVRFAAEERTIIINEGLKTGDRVVIIRGRGGGIYVALAVIGGTEDAS